MTNLSRRLFIASGTAAVSMASIGLAHAQSADVGSASTVTLAQALKLRQSIRVYSSSPIDETQLLALLAAANGVNRADIDGRTAPSWRTALDTEIYVASATGVSRYDANGGALIAVGDQDIRTSLSTQPFVATAPVVLIYLSDRDKLIAAGGSADDETGLAVSASVNAAVIAQNVYLYAAAEGLGTCLVGGADRDAIRSALALPDSISIPYVQPVGQVVSA